MTSRVLAAAFTGLLLAGARLVAHHEILAKFDDHKPVTLNGIVTLVDWRNPHVHVFMNVPDAAGLVNWAIELEGPIDLERSGWSRETLRPGDRVRVAGFSARNGSHQAWGNSVVVRATGKSVYNVTLTPPAAPLEPRPTPRWPDRQPRLGAAQGGSTGYWAYPSVTALAEGNSADKIAIPMDTWGLLKNIADAPKVAPMQPWALQLYTERQKRFLQDDPMYLNCKPPGGSRQFQLAYGVQLVEDRDRKRIFVLIGSGNNNYRIINTDGRSHKGQVGGDDENLLYYGRSVGQLGGRHPGGRHPGIQRGLLVHQRRAAPHRSAQAARTILPPRLRHAEVRCHRRGPRRLHAAVVQQFHASLGRGRRDAAALVSGQQVVEDERRTNR